MFKRSEFPKELIEEAKKDPFIFDDVEEHTTGYSRITYEGSVVGFIISSKSSYKSNPVTLINAVFIGSKHRNKNLSTKALEEMITKSGDYITYVDVKNEPSKRMLEKAGFEVVKEVKGSKSTAVFNLMFFTNKKSHWKEW